MPNYVMKVGTLLPFNVTAGNDKGARLQCRDALSFLLSPETPVLLKGPDGGILFDTTIAEIRNQSL